MKDLIIKALDDFYARQMSSVQETMVPVYVDADYILPINFPTFMKENNIPDDAELVANEYGNLRLVYMKAVPTTDKYKEEFIKARFTAHAEGWIFNTLKENGYKRRAGKTTVEQYNLWKKTNKVFNIYDLYINKEFDEITKYCSNILFEKE